MSKKIFGRWRLYLFLSAIVVFWAFHANIPPMGLDESMYMTASQEMAAGRDFVVPCYNGEPFFDKPPMTYWLQAGSRAFFDVFLQGKRLDTSGGWLPADGRLFGYRAVSALSALLLLWLVVVVGKSLFSPKTAIYAGFAFAFSLLTVALAKMAIMDMLLSLWCSGALFIFLLTYLNRLKKQWIILAFVLLAGALLTKGPIAFGIAGLPVLVFLIAKRNLKFMFDRWTLAGFAFMLILAVPWYLAAEIRTGSFWYEFFVHQNVQRALGQDFAHSYNPLFYVGIILVGMAPWSWFVVPAAVKYCKGKKSMAALQFLSLWVISLFVMFTAINSRLPGYIFPVFPAAALLVGKYMDEYKPGRLNDAMLVCSMILSLVLGAAIGAAPWLLAFQTFWARLVMGATGAWLAVWGICIYVSRSKGVPMPGLICQILGFLALFTAVLPLVGLNGATLKDEADTKSDYLGTTGYILSRDFGISSMPDDIVLIGYKMHPLSVNFPFFAGRKVEMPKDRNELAGLLEKNRRYFLVTDTETLKKDKLGRLLPGQPVIDEKYLGRKNGLFISSGYSYGGK